MTLPIPFDWDAFNQGLAPIFDVAASLPVGSSQPGVRRGIGGTSQDGQQAFYFPQNDGSGNLDSQNTLAKITFSITNVRGIGWEEWRRTYDPTIVIPGDTFPGNLGGIVYSNEGNRVVTVSLLCECWDLTGAGAAQYLERIRTAITLPGFILSLRALKCAINDIGITQPADYTDDNGRDVSGAMLEFKFNISDAALDIPITTIEKVTRPRFVPITP